MIPVSLYNVFYTLYIKEYFWSYDQKYYNFLKLFSLYFSSLNLKYLKYLKLTKMESFCDGTLHLKFSKLWLIMPKFYLTLLIHLT